LTQEQEALVRLMHIAGIFTRYILVALLQAFPDCLASRKDISNCIARYKELLLGGKTPIEALVESLDANPN